jgi:hypothetical protein
MGEATIRDLRNNSAEALIARFSRLPQVDPERFRADVDEAVDQSL